MLKCSSRILEEGAVACPVFCLLLLGHSLNTRMFWVGLWLLCCVHVVLTARAENALEQLREQHAMLHACKSPRLDTVFRSCACSIQDALGKIIIFQIEAMHFIKPHYMELELHKLQMLQNQSIRSLHFFIKANQKAAIELSITFYQIGQYNK